MTMWLVYRSFSSSLVSLSKHGYLVSATLLLNLHSIRSSTRSIHHTPAVLVLSLLTVSNHIFVGLPHPHLSISVHYYPLMAIIRKKKKIQICIEQREITCTSRTWCLPMSGAKIGGFGESTRSHLCIPSGIIISKSWPT